ncbi:MAG: DNA-processing protein DprA [Candidatus Omnitrophica bacterium]|nr:DNA-processing protein DprA [Candidatus Omnitrophota bacterium]
MRRLKLSLKMKVLTRKDNFITLSLSDQGYPANLKYIYDPPQTLYVQGKLFPQDNIAIAIVGSRRATYYGLNNAENLAFELAALGITIVSGLARGVDSAAHKGALKAGGRTIAVLGSGLNVIYPAENQELAEEIARHGAVISEFTPDTGPQRYNFPRRNRIISGLSLGIVVVEAAKKSGALITAYSALDQGREVFALPGKVDSFTSRGTHDLIKQGAKLVDSTQDILEELEPLLAAYTKEHQDKEQPTIQPNLTEEENSVYSCLSSEALQVDEIMQKTNFSYGRLSTALLKLEYKKLIKQLPGKTFMRL